MTFAIGAPVAVPAVAFASRWLVLRCRTELVRAAGELPPGVQVSGRDAGGTWTATRTAAPQERPR